MQTPREVFGFSPLRNHRLRAARAAATACQLQEQVVAVRFSPSPLRHLFQALARGKGQRFMRSENIPGFPQPELKCGARLQNCQGTKMGLKGGFCLSRSSSLHIPFCPEAMRKMSYSMSSDSAFGSAATSAGQATMATNASAIRMSCIEKTP